MKCVYTAYEGTTNYLEGKDQSGKYYILFPDRTAKIEVTRHKRFNTFSVCNSQGEEIARRTLYDVPFSDGLDHIVSYIGHISREVTAYYNGKPAEHTLKNIKRQKAAEDGQVYVYLHVKPHEKDGLYNVVYFTTKDHKTYSATAEKVIEAKKLNAAYSLAAEYVVSHAGLNDAAEVIFCGEGPAFNSKRLIGARISGNLRETGVKLTVEQADFTADDYERLGVGD